MTPAGQVVSPHEDALADPVTRAGDISRGVAAEHADQVDRTARFPAEAMAAVRAARLLAACAPTESGGLGCTMRQAVRVAEALAAGCSATAMTWAMHQIQLACLARHGHSDHLRRYTAQVCRDQLLLASATSEAGVGGDIRISRAAVEREGDLLLIEKDAATVSYGADADAVLATLRRSSQAVPSDQVLVVLPTGLVDLEQRSEWNALGMRGTGSCGYRLRGRVAADWVLPDPFDLVHSRTMLPYSHLLWAACWAGISAGALARARAQLRQRERRNPGSAGSATVRLAHAYSRLQAARAMIGEAADEFDRADREDAGERWSTGLHLNGVKVAVSEVAVEVTMAALTICGFAGYSEQGPYSVARHLRDVLSAPLMISNERLLATNGGLLLTRKGEPRSW